MPTETEIADPLPPESATPPHLEKIAVQVESGSSDGDLRALILAFPELRRAYLAAAVRCLGASKFYFSREKRRMVTTPDGATVMKAVIFLASYDAGLPVQATLNVNLDATGGKSAPSLAEAAAQSPSLRRLLADTLARAEKTADAAA